MPAKVAEVVALARKELGMIYKRKEREREREREREKIKNMYPITTVSLYTH